MLLLISLISLNIILIVLMFFFLNKLYKQFKKKQRNLFDDPIWPISFSIVVILVVTFSCVFWDNFYNISRSVFNSEEPICMEHVGTFEVKSHWSSPNLKYIEIPYSVNRFQVKFKTFCCSYSKKVVPGGRVFVEELDVKPGIDSVHLYVYHYKKIGPFGMPDVLKDGILSKNVPELYEQRKCIETVKLKNYPKQ